MRKDDLELLKLIQQGPQPKEPKAPDKESKKPEAEKNPAAVELGRRGGKVGGYARAQKLSPERRSEIAKIAANKRWKNSNFDPGL